MNKTCKKSIALLLVILQLVVLLPVTAVQTKAVDPEPAATETTAPQPVLNPVIRGTVQFGTFNFTGAVGSKEAADYVMPFLYTDDYFATSAIQPNVTGKEMSWKALENKSLATASMDFTMACFGSNEEITSKDDYESEYDKNGRTFLEACDFKFIESNNYTYDGSNLLTKDNQYNKFPTQDSIGVIVGVKDITVWTGEQNETFKLVAIGVRGAGYGAEWASNFTLGASGEHHGFREAADKVEYKLEDYLEQRDITATDNVKFWVCGYSRAGAVANLVAGDLTSKYSVDKANVYGYTFESAAGADASIDADGRTYPNIHNILSKMDAVPRVSAQFFGNNRYGVDYIVPYYGNTQDVDGLNEAYYNRMYSILPTVAQGYYDADGNVKADPVLTDAMPSTAGGTYPVDGEITVQKFELTSVSSTEYDDWKGTPIGKKGNDGYYHIQLDTFLDQFVQRFVETKAWDYDARYPKEEITLTNPSTHRQRYASVNPGQTTSYQEAIRTLAGIALGTPGTKLKDLLSGVEGARSSLIGPAASLLRKLKLFADWTWGYDIQPSEKAANSVNSDIEEMLNIVLQTIPAFQARQAESEAAVKVLSPVLTRLFLYDRSQYGSQYLGTVLKYVSTILVAHTPELDVSWQMAMDENYTSSYRTITLPRAADVTAYVFRPGVDDTLPQNDPAAAVAAKGAEIATLTGGTLESSDQRFEIIADDGAAVTLRYPGTLDLRFDITGDTTGLRVTDLQPDQKQVNIKADYDRRDDNGNIIPETRDVSYEGLLTDRPGASANALNARTDLALSEGETLHVMAWHGSNSLDLPQMQAVENTYDAVKSVTVKWVMDDAEETVIAETQAVSGTVPTAPEAPEKAATPEYRYEFKGWVDENGMFVDSFPAVTGSVTYTAVYTPIRNAYTVVWKDYDGTPLGEDEVYYGERPAYSGAEPERASDEQYTYRFDGWTVNGEEAPVYAPDALPEVTGDAEYTAHYAKVLRVAVTFYADDVQNKNGGEPMLLTGGAADSSGVVQQPNYPSYMGYTLAGVTVVSGGVETEIAAENNAIPTAAINEAIHGNRATVTAHYEQDQTNTYNVRVIYVLTDGTEISSYVTEDYVVGKAMQITASEEKTFGGTTYYFQYWEVDGGERYETRVITLRPNEGSGRTYTIRAVMGAEKPASEKATVAILNTYAETQAGKNKIGVTMTWSAPGVEAIEYAGFRVIWEDGATTVVNNKYSRLTTPTGTYTLHINRTGAEAEPVRIEAVLAYHDGAGELQTLWSEPVECSWNGLSGSE